MGKVALLMLLSTCSWAATPPFWEAGKVEKTLEGVKVMSEVSTPLPVNGKGSVRLTLSGAGIRRKKVLITSVDVYVAAHYVDATTKGEKAKAMVMTFLRDIDNEKIRDSFTDALKENDVKIEGPLQKFLSGIKFDIKERDRWVFVGTNDALFLLSPSATLSEKAPGIASAFWKAWFGKPADGGLEELKPQLQTQPVNEFK